jgi:hypothetical protein
MARILTGLKVTDAQREAAQHAGPGRRGAVPNRGPFSSEDEALREVVKRLVSGIDPEQIWLFGSRAENRHAPDSDFDILVVTKTTDGDAAFDYDAVYAPIKGLGVGCDVIPCRADEFEQERNDPTSICWQIVRNGRMLYERSEKNRGVLHARGSSRRQREYAVPS